MKRDGVGRNSTYISSSLETSEPFSVKNGSRILDTR
jgi:hypothetical protein